MIILRTSTSNSAATHEKRAETRPVEKEFVAIVANVGHALSCCTARDRAAIGRVNNTTSIKSAI